MYKYVLQGFLMIIMIFHSSCPSNNDNSRALLFFLTVLSECDIQFRESNVSKKSICTPWSWEKPLPFIFRLQENEVISPYYFFFSSPLEKGVWHSAPLWCLCNRAWGLVNQDLFASHPNQRGCGLMDRGGWGPWGENSRLGRKAPLEGGFIYWVRNGPDFQRENEGISRKSKHCNVPRGP